MPCKFKSICNQYSDTSETCQKSGGSYCGKYREITERENESMTKSVENYEFKR